jgi:hypothetical protein
VGDTTPSQVNLCYAALVKCAIQLSPLPVKSVFVTADESFAILFLVAILVAIAFLVTVVGILICIVLIWVKIFAPIQILSSSLEAVSITRVQGNVGVSPPGVRVGVLVPAGKPVRIVSIIQPINVRAYRPAVVSVVVSDLVSVAISMLEVVVLTHIPLVPLVSTFVVSRLEIMLFMAVSIIAALT